MAIRGETPKIELKAGKFARPLKMELEQFFEFSFWLAEELLDLEAEFSNWQTPASAPLALFDANGLPEDLEIDFESC